MKSIQPGRWKFNRNRFQGLKLCFEFFNEFLWRSACFLEVLMDVIQKTNLFWKLSQICHTLSRKSVFCFPTNSIFGMDKSKGPNSRRCWLSDDPAHFNRCWCEKKTKENAIFAIILFPKRSRLSMDLFCCFIRLANCQTCYSWCTFVFAVKTRTSWVMGRPTSPLTWWLMSSGTCVRAKMLHIVLIPLRLSINYWNSKVFFRPFLNFFSEKPAGGLLLNQEARSKCNMREAGWYHCIV